MSESSAPPASSGLPGVTVGVIDGSRSRELRRSVLRPEFDPTEALPGDERADAVHFGAATDTGKIVSTCLVFGEAYPGRLDDTAGSGDLAGWQLRSMATRPDWRGQGLGAQVLAAVVDYIGAHGGGILWCNARDLAVPMYERGGLVTDGDSFTEHDIVHWRMWRTVAP